MRIGIDCRTILDETAREKAGIAHYTYYLVKNLLRLDQTNEYVLFFEDRVNARLLDEVREWGSKVAIKKFRFSKYKRYLPYVYSHLFLASEILQAQLDIFHSPANIVPLRLLLNPRRPKIVSTVHDLAICRHPEWFPRGQGFSVKYLVPKTVRLIDRLIVPSQATARDLQELFHISQEKITVVPHGVEERFFKPPTASAGSGSLTGSGDIHSLDRPSAGYHLPATPYILFVGTIEPRKNLSRLVEAYVHLPADIQENYDLILAGSLGWKYQDLLRQIQMANDKFQKEKIKVFGYYPGSQLPELLQNAAIFVYPSLYEGFGLPVLEAMAAGAPVVASSAASLAEICPKGAGIHIDPMNVKDITEAIVKLIRDTAYAKSLSAAATQKARAFTWRDTAEKTLGIYHDLWRGDKRHLGIDE